MKNDHLHKNLTVRKMVFVVLDPVHRLIGWEIQAIGINQSRFTAWFVKGSKH